MFKIITKCNSNTNSRTMNNTTLTFVINLESEIHPMGLNNKLDFCIPVMECMPMTLQIMDQDKSSGKGAAHAFSVITTDFFAAMVRDLQCIMS